MKHRTEIKDLFARMSAITKKMEAIFFSKGIQLFDFSNISDLERDEWMKLKEQKDVIADRIARRILNKS